MLPRFLSLLSWCCDCASDRPEIRLVGAMNCAPLAVLIDQGNDGANYVRFNQTDDIDGCMFVLTVVTHSFSLFYLLGLILSHLAGPNPFSHSLGCVVCI